MRPELPTAILERRAIVYVRQSTSGQVHDNLESQRRQYELAEVARGYGFRDVVVIDEDLGRSASGAIDRPGFRALVGQICEGLVGAVLCLEASRLARNGRDWHHLLELCGLVGARVIDADGIYDPGAPNDRLLLGLKGTMSEFELTLLRRRMLDAAVAKARRGELRLFVPIGYVWSRDLGLMLNPDRRIQEAVRTVFRLFDRLGTARQVFLHMHREGLLFPRPTDGRRGHALCWKPPVYQNVISVLQNPFYAGAYAYGKTHVQAKIVDGVVRKFYGRSQPIAAWTALVLDHHEGYITWPQYQRNQERFARNCFRKPAGASKAARGGAALLGGLLRCRRCGRLLGVTYGGRGVPRPRYSCRRGHWMNGAAPCITFGAARTDAAIAQAILVVVQPLAVEAAVVAEHELCDQGEERRRALGLEREQAAYEVQLSQRRYEQVDPDNRLVAAELESRWNAALAQLRACEARLAVSDHPPAPPVATDTLVGLAQDLAAAWRAPTTTSRTRQRLVRALIEEIAVDVDNTTREVVLVVHWRGGQHSELRVRKPTTGEHSRRAPEEALRLVRDMAGKWSDEEIAATLNRMGFTTGQRNTWTAARVHAFRQTHDIRAAASAAPDGGGLTLLEAAQHFGVSRYRIRQLIHDGLLPARQVVPDAPWQIHAAELARPEVQRALRHRTGRGRPCQNSRDDRTLKIPGT